MHNFLRARIIAQNQEQLRFGEPSPFMPPLFPPYLEAVERYSARTLRYDQDSLHAFRGVMRSYEKRKLSPIRQLWGVPLPVVDDFAESWRYFADGLTWCHRHTWRDAANAPRRRSQFPTWPWAGWQGEVVYEERYDRSMYEKGDIYPQIQVLEPSRGLCARLLTTSSSTPDSEAESTKELVLNACTIPADRFSYQGHDMWSLDLWGHQGLAFLSLSTRPRNGIEDSRLLKQQTIRCIPIGSLGRFSLRIMVLERSDLGDGREVYSRIGIFKVAVPTGCVPAWTTGSEEPPKRSVVRII